MAKRFTDTNKYKKPFLRNLPGAYKLLWDFLYHDCDHAGIWIVDFEIAQTYVGKDMPITQAGALTLFNDDEIRIVKIDGGKKWFIPSFILFQYGKLSEKNRAHLNVISVLKKYDLINSDFSLKPLTSPLQGAKEMEQEEEKEKEQENARIENLIPAMSKMFLEKNEGYPEDQIKDFQSLRKIAVHFGKILGFKEQTIFTNKDEQYAIKLRWGELVSFIGSDKHFSRYSLTQIEKYFQSIIQAKNGNFTKKHSQSVGQEMDFDNP
jgi:hypothetical protein